MDKRLQEMLDHYEITKTLNEYCHGLDRMDHARMAGIYAKNSYDNHGPFQASGPDFVTQVLGIMKDGSSHGDAHMLGQTLIKVDGDTAGADTYFLSTSRKVNDDGSEVLLQMGGRYVDKLVREDGIWKVKHRVCVRDWSISLPVATDWMKGMNFVEGQRSNADPSYGVLGITHSGFKKQ